MTETIILNISVMPILRVYPMKYSMKIARIQIAETRIFIMKEKKAGKTAPNKAVFLIPSKRQVKRLKLPQNSAAFFRYPLEIKFISVIISRVSCGNTQFVK